MKAPRRGQKVEKSNFAKFKGSILAQHGSQEGSQERSKIESKSIENQFSLELAVGKSPGPQKVLKNYSKMHPNRYQNLPAIIMVSHRTDINKFPLELAFGRSPRPHKVLINGCKMGLNWYQNLRTISLTFLQAPSSCYAMGVGGMA